MRARNKVAGALVAIVAAVGLAACTGGGGDAGPSTAGGGSSTFVWGQAGGPESLDPYLSEGGGYYPYLTPVYDTLIRLDSDGKLQPGLALSWGYSTDGMSFTMKLRDGVTFSDGQPFDAEAVKENLDRAKTVQGPRTAQLAAVGSVTADDPTTVTIHLAQGLPSLTSILSDVLGMMVSPAALDNPDLAQNPVGTGPYVLDTAKTTAGDTYTYTKRTDYWDASNYPYDTLVVRVIPDENTMYQALRSGEIQGAVGLNSMVQQAKDDGLQVLLSPVNFSGMFLYDRTGTQVPALADVRVRQALNYAVDRQAIVDSVANGLGTPTSQILPPGIPGYVKDLDGYYGYDTAKAKQLLSDAGYPNGFTLPVLSSTFLGLDAQVQLLCSYFEAVGVHCDITTAQPGDYIPDMIQGKAAAAQFLWGAQDVFLDSASLTAPTGAFNPFKASDDQLNSLISQAATADEASRVKLYEQWNTRVTEQAWFVATHFQDVTMFVSPTVGNVTWWPNRATPSFFGWAPAQG